MTSDTEMETETPAHSGHGLIITVLAFMLGELAKMIDNAMPVAAFFLTMLSIISVSIVIVSNLPKFVRVVKSGFTHFKKNKPHG